MEVALRNVSKLLHLRVRQGHRPEAGGSVSQVLPWLLSKGRGYALWHETGRRGRKCNFRELCDNRMVRDQKPKEQWMARLFHPRQGGAVCTVPMRMTVKTADSAGLLPR